MALYEKIIDPGGSGDYTSISAWATAVATLYSSGDTARAVCRRTTSAKDTTNYVLTGWTAGVNIEIIVDPNYRHNGKWSDTNRLGNYVYYMDFANDSGHGLRWSTANPIVIDGLAIQGSSTSATNYTMLYMSAASTATVKNCLLKGTFSGGSTMHGIATNNTSGTFTIYNCISYGFYYDFRCAGGPTTFYNCTAYGGNYPFEGLATTVYINCCGMGATGGRNFPTTYGSTSDYNVSSTSAAPGTNIAVSKSTYTDYFVDHTNGNLHLKASSLSLWGLAGTDLSSIFTTDIDGTTRATWDIGADYPVPVQIVKTVKTDGGGDFTNLDAALDWIGTNYSNLVTADVAITINCYGTTVDTTSPGAERNGWTTDSTRFVTINGDGTYKLTLSTSWIQALWLPTYSVINRLKIEFTVADSANIVVSSNTTVKNCTLWCSAGSSTGNTWGIQVMGDVAGVKIYNNIVYGCGYGIGNYSWETHSGTFQIYNNTIYGCSVNGIFIELESSTCNVIVKNNISLASGTADYQGSSYVDTAEYNVSSDATAFGTNKATGKTTYANYFVDYTNKNFHLKGPSATVFGLAGTNLSSIFTTDIDGFTRDTWDVGADGYLTSLWSRHNSLVIAAGASTYNLTSSISSVSATSTADATLVGIYNLTSAITTVSTTSTASVIKSLVSSITTTSVTEEVLGTVVHLIVVSITSVSTTSEVSASTAKNLYTSILAESITSEATIEVTRYLTSNISTVTISSEAFVSSLRPLEVYVVYNSVVSEATSSVLRSLTATISNISISSEATISANRNLAASLAISTITGEVNVSALRSLLSTVSTTTETSIATADVAQWLYSSISTISETSQVTLDIVRALVSSIATTSSTKTSSGYVYFLSAMPPNSITSTTNLSGVVGDIDDDPDSPDGNWLTKGAGGSTVLYATFGTPSGTIYGEQEFRVLVRKSGTGTTSARIELWENGSLVRAGNNTSVTSESGQVLSFTWYANEITNSGDVEIKVFGMVA